MASQVLSGSSNASYTNNTGQNVRLVINFMNSPSAMSWGGVSYTSSLAAIGRNLAFQSGGYLSGVELSLSANNAFGAVNPVSGAIQTGAMPTEIMLAPTQTFTATCGAYNIVVIPEAG